MANRSYLSKQIRLIGLSTNDLLTDEQYKTMGQMYACWQTGDQAGKNAALVQLKQLIKNHVGIRKVATNRVMTTYDSCRDKRFEACRAAHPEWFNQRGQWKGIFYRMLRNKYKIAEFESVESRAMGLHHLDITLDKIIIKWKREDILKDIVLNGFQMDVVNPDGSVVTKTFHVMTASAGQLRRDKIQCLSEDVWQFFDKPQLPTQINKTLMCGLTWDQINSHQKKGKFGINVNKLMAYMALSTCATEVWDMDIDRCIVIPDFEAPVTGVMDYINGEVPGKQFQIQRGQRTVTINHCDGIGMVLPYYASDVNVFQDTLPHNFMVRAPWIKGLLTPFDFIQFCKQNNVPPIIKDDWGQQHDLVKQDIRVIFTDSQFKLAKYYKDWDDYKARFKANNCSLNRMNYQMSDMQKRSPKGDTEICYQMVQTLLDMSNEQIDLFSATSRRHIHELSGDKNTLMRVLGISKTATISGQPDWYRMSLAQWLPLFRAPYTWEGVWDIRDKWINNGKSCKIKCRNKRLFAIPDMYAACQHWFLGEQAPKGLLNDRQIYSRIYNPQPASVLRSPHLYMQWTIRNFITNPQLQKWFVSGGIYTSCHDLISRILQFDKQKLCRLTQ